MKNYILSKLFLLLSFIFLIINTVKANDCEVIDKLVKTLGHNLEKEYRNQTISSCCNAKEITCQTIDNVNYVTEIKFNNKNKICEGDGIVDIEYAMESDMINTKSKEEAKKEFNENFLCEQNLTEVVNILSNLKHLSTLEITQYGIVAELPENINQLKSLKHLNLSCNNLKQLIPKNLGNMNNLVDLNLSGNFLEGYVPYSFKNLKVENLNLSNNYNLKGYVPLIDNLKTCDYSSSEICYLKHAKCTIGSEKCFEDNIKDANLENGNPNPESNEFDDEYYEYSKGYIIIFIILFMVIAIAVIYLIIKFIKNKRDNDEIELNYYNDYNDNNGNRNNDNDELPAYSEVGGSTVININNSENNPPPAYSEIDRNNQN